MRSRLWSGKAEEEEVEVKVVEASMRMSWSGEDWTAG